jgi:hypothetical protein
MDGLTAELSTHGCIAAIRIFTTSSRAARQDAPLDVQPTSAPVSMEDLEERVAAE